MVDSIRIGDATVQNLSSAPFGQICGQTAVRMTCCHYSNTLLEKVSCQVGAKNITYLQLYCNHNDDYVLQISDLWTIFPNLNHISLHYMPLVDTWMTEILEHDNHSITELHLRITDRQQVTALSTNVVAFLQAQKKGFYLRLIVPGIEEDVPFQLDQGELLIIEVLEVDLLMYLNQKLPQYIHRTRLLVQNHTSTLFVWFF
uniref:F-box/FBD/LRR-repeat protein n=1 Tax=Panagrellus redivivus TaxID=6233 RepID=A0A7E4ZWW1_PANRE